MACCGQGTRQLGNFRGESKEGETPSQRVRKADDTHPDEGHREASGGDGHDGGEKGER